MGDPLLIRRVARTIQEVGINTKPGEGYWEALSEAAVAEVARTVNVTVAAVTAHVLVLTKQRDGRYLAVGDDRTITGAVAAATAHLQAEGVGEVLVAEVKKRVTVT